MGRVHRQLSAGDRIRLRRPPLEIWNRLVDVGKSVVVCVPARGRRLSGGLLSGVAGLDASHQIRAAYRLVA